MMNKINKEEAEVDQGICQPGQTGLDLTQLSMTDLEIDRTNLDRKEMSTTML